jgi:hypothetical protein
VGSVNVKDFGALGDGAADDTTAFEQALLATSETHEPILVPEGRYRLTRGLTLAQQTLTGQPQAAWVGDNNALPVIVPEAVDGPCLRLKGGSSVTGLYFSYDWKGKAPEAIPPAIELAGVGCRVSECKFQSAWDAIVADGKSNVGRALVSDCFIVDAHHIGVRMTGTWDSSWISRVEVWSPTSPTAGSIGVGFLLGRNDVLLVSDCFAFSLSRGFLLADKIEGCQIEGGTWGSLANCSADFCGIGVEVRGLHTVSLAGGTYLTHFGGLLVDGKGADVRVTGLELASNGAPALEVRDCELVTASSCQLRRLCYDFDQPALRIAGGLGTVVTGCALQSSSKGIEVAEGLADVIVENNLVKEFYSRAEQEEAEK